MPFAALDQLQSDTKTYKKEIKLAYDFLKKANHKITQQDYCILQTTVPSKFKYPISLPLMIWIFPLAIF